MDGHPLMLLTDGVPERQESALRLPVQWVEVEDFHHRVSLPELPLSERLKIYKRVCENHWQVEKGHRLCKRLSKSLGKFPSFQPLPLDQRSSRRRPVYYTPGPPLSFHGTVGGMQSTL